MRASGLSHPMTLRTKTPGSLTYPLPLRRERNNSTLRGGHSLRRLVSPHERQVITLGIDAHRVSLSEVTAQHLLR